MGVSRIISRLFGSSFRHALDGIAEELNLDLTWLSDSGAYADIDYDGERYVVVFVQVGDIVQISVPSTVHFRPGRVPVALTSAMLKGNQTREWGEWGIRDSDDESHLALKLPLKRNRLSSGLVATAMSEMIDEVSALDRKLKTL